ncbi:hypothetical protein V6Z11_A09G090200 [Gossypium hirsutum]
MLSNSQFSSNDGDGDPHPESDRNTKKVRFKDNLVEEDTIMDRDPNPKLTLLWKDKLLGGLTVDSALDCSAPTEGSNNDLRLLEGDVNTAIIDGVPAITFSNRIKDILFKEIELMVIVKLLRRNIGYNALHNRILFLWKPVNSISIMDTVNGFFWLNFRLLRITTEYRPKALGSSMASTYCSTMD